MNPEIIAATTELSTAMLELSTTADTAAAAFTSATRSAEALNEQALVVQRVVSTVRKRFREYDAVQGMLSELIEALEGGDAPKATALARFAAERMHELTEDMQGRLGIATGTVHRWTLGAEAAAQSARRANTAVQSSREAIAKVSEAAQHLLLDWETALDRPALHLCKTEEDGPQQACH